jgi:hypothetical protein
MGTVGGAQVSSEAGIYHWDLSTDRLCVDSAVANLIGMDPALAEAGFPLARYMERVHENDRDALDNAVRISLATGAALNVSYRLRNACDDYVDVIESGRCFACSGEPSFMSGIVFPFSTHEAAAFGHLLAAHSQLERDGASRDAKLVLDLIGRLIAPEAHEAQIYKFASRRP